MINPLKCEWAFLEIYWLGYWLLSHGFNPWKERSAQCCTWIIHVHHLNFANLLVVWVTTLVCGQVSNVFLNPSSNILEQRRINSSIG
ncbi:hypothetical protein ACHAW6_004981 [Cyclotella cf. meneghiniana]